MSLMPENLTLLLKIFSSFMLLVVVRKHFFVTLLLLRLEGEVK